MEQTMTVDVAVAAEVNRFGWLWWSIPLHAFYASILILLTGYGYLQGIVLDYLVDINASRLNFLLGMKEVFTFVLWLCAMATGWWDIGFTSNEIVFHYNANI